MSILKGFYSIGEGFASMFDWMRPTKEVTIDVDAAFKEYYKKYPEFAPGNREEWHTTTFTTELPQPQQAQTPLRDPARRANRKRFLGGTGPR